MSSSSPASFEPTVERTRKNLIFYLNGKRTEVHRPDPVLTMLEYLRTEARLMGTKLGCGEGGCGACTVMVTRWELQTSKSGDENVTHGSVVRRAINACLMPLCSADSCHITTVEGIGTAAAPHPVQERMAVLSGSQCGFCTPGIVMALYSSLQNNPQPTLRDIEDSFDGNLCRCTGYRPILDAAKTFACNVMDCPGACGQPPGSVVSACGGKSTVKTTTLSKSLTPTVYEAVTLPWDPLKYPPVELPAELIELSKDTLHFDQHRVHWYRPSTFHELLILKKKFPHAKIVGGATEIRIETKFKKLDYAVLISPHSIPEMHQLHISNKDGGLEIGGCITLTQLVSFLHRVIPESPPSSVANFEAMLNMFNWFASSQIRNSATIAGNICTASPICDSSVIMLAVGAILRFKKLDVDALRNVDIRSFFKSYRTTDCNPEEVLVSIYVPATKPLELIQSYKQARRRDDDMSTVSCCFRCQLELVEGPADFVITSFRSGYGGMAPISTPSYSLEQLLQGKHLSTIDTPLVNAIHAALSKDFCLPPSVPGGMPAFRMALATSFVVKFLAYAMKMVGVPCDDDVLSMVPSYMHVPREVTHGSQEYVLDPEGGGLLFSKLRTLKDGKTQMHEDATPTEGLSRFPVGEPIQHRAGLLHTTGEAKYVDDISPPVGTLSAVFLLSERPTGTINSIDFSAALAMPGVIAFFSAKDLLPGTNTLGPIVLDEELFRETTVTSTGQPIGILIAENEVTAQQALRLVKVSYGDGTKKPVISVADAMSANTMANPKHTIEDGDIRAGFENAEVIIEGEVRIGGQEHFYLECNAALAVPDEGGELTVYASTQTTMKTQKFAALVCGLDHSKVVCKMKRMGGGFGGKETRSVFVSTAAAFAAHRLRRPVRIALDRDVDMWTTGTRHPFYATYKVGALKDGKVVAVELNLYSNAGYSMDLSQPVMDRALLHCDNTYKFPALKATGHVCITNTVSNTAFRGFGGPQGMMVCESFMDHLCATLHLDPNDVRRINMYREGDRTHFGQVFERNTLPRLWEKIMDSAQVQKRSDEINAFNKTSRYIKRGLSVIPTKFGINFTAKFMNQAGALVHIYTDGTVLVHHGGTEMGQGLNTKCIQVAARALRIPVDCINISEASTSTVANAIPTAASCGSDFYGMAILDACEQLNERLRPYWAKAKETYSSTLSIKEQFKKVASSAFFDRINLSAQGFYRAPECGFDWDISVPPGGCNSIRGTPFRYFTCGVACTEVQIDVLTGDSRVLRADILMDLGQSMNPVIDIGQIEGAYVQGYGWCMLEETVWGCEEHRWLKPGTCFTRGPGAYKIPSFNDIPIDFRITLLDDAPNPKAIHSSKAVGEPPLFLAASAFFATKAAIAAARKDSLGVEVDGSLKIPFHVDSPLTPERIRLACADDIAQKCVAAVVEAGGSSRPSLFC